MFMITYNHGPYIRQSIESILMQKTNFAYEIVIGEDCSTDNTRSIIKELEQRYPDIIKPIYHEKNVGAMRNAYEFCYPNLKGKYIACFEGDDYWTDPLKLQKQVDFLEANPDVLLCSHTVDEFLQGSNSLIKTADKGDRYLTFQDFATNGCGGVYTLSMLFRNDGIFKKTLTQPWTTKLDGGDHLLLILATLKGQGVYILPDNMGVYRRHAGGVWTGESNVVKLLNTFKNIDTYKSNLELDANQVHYLEWSKKNSLRLLFYHRIRKFPRLVRGFLFRLYEKTFFSFGPGALSTRIINRMERSAIRNYSINRVDQP